MKKCSAVLIPLRPALTSMDCLQNATVAPDALECAKFF